MNEKTKKDVITNQEETNGIVKQVKSKKHKKIILIINKKRAT